MNWLFKYYVTALPGGSAPPRVGQDGVLGSCERDELLVRADGVGPRLELASVRSIIGTMASRHFEKFVAIIAAHRIPDLARWLGTRVLPGFVKS